MPRLRGVWSGRERKRGWAGRLLVWTQTNLLFRAETGRVRYFVTSGPYEFVAWCEVRDLAGRRRIAVGTFGTVAEAQAACEADAQRRLQRGEDDGPVGRADRAVARAEALTGGRHRGAGFASSPPAEQTAAR
jgi:hypothetical protein